MTRETRRALIMAAVPALAIGLWIGQSRAQNPAAAGAGAGAIQQPNATGNRMGPNQLRYLGQYVKIGKHRMNISQISYTRDEGKAMVINFASGSEIRLQENEAEALRHWIDLGSGYPTDAP
jgi:hypothetical protein